MNTSDRRLLAKEGEQAAVAFLKSKQFVIRETNFRCAGGEIDIIAEDKEILVFIEVKTRSNEKFGLPEEAVDSHKQKKLIYLASYYLQKEHLHQKYCRFDVIAIIIKNHIIERIEHLIDAFSA